MFRRETTRENEVISDGRLRYTERYLIRGVAKSTGKERFLLENAFTRANSNEIKAIADGR